MKEDEVRKWITGKTAYEVFLSIKAKLNVLSPSDQRKIWDIYHEVNEPTPEQRKQIIDRLF